MKVSILSAVFNEERHLEEMISSIQAQDFTDWELLFVSDGSTDGTDRLIAAAGANDPRVRLVTSGAKVGKVAAFNAAYEASSGDVIVLLAGDDTLPPTSLSARVGLLRDVDPARDDVVAYFKLRTMSDSPQHDALVLPRGQGASHSGGTITLTRHLAERVFPIEGSLVSEDLWLTRASEGLADDVRESTEIVLNYRIHDSNSNPRNRPFAQMSHAMAARHRAWRLLLDCPRWSLAEDTRLRLERLANLECLRLEGRTLAILLTRSAPLGDRAAYAAMSSRFLYGIRRRFFRLLSGRRSR